MMLQLVVYTPMAMLQLSHVVISHVWDGPCILLTLSLQHMTFQQNSDEMNICILLGFEH